MTPASNGWQFISWWRRGRNSAAWARAVGVFAMRGFFLKLMATAGVGLIFFSSANGASQTNEFSFNDYLLVPVRVHLLQSKDSAIQTTLTTNDITRILGKMNGIWAQAGVHFYLESLVSEEANVPADTSGFSGRAGDRDLLKLRPLESRATNAFNVYYLKQMSVNGFYSGAVLVKDTASLRKVEGGIDEPIPRVTSHELGHAFGLSHRQNTTNLMASGTTGTWLNHEEISRARETARRLDWVEAAPVLMEKANALFRANKAREAAILYSRLAKLPLNDPKVEIAKKRAAGSK